MVGGRIGPMFDVVVLAGGSARRFGRDKLLATVDGRPMLDRVLAAATGAEPTGRIVVVGPHRRTEIDPARLTWTREHPAGSGPLAGLAAGLAYCVEPVVVVLAADMPLLDRTVVDRLVRSLTEGGDGADGAALVDADGRTQPLAAAYRRDAVVAALAGIGDPAGLGMFRLLDRLRVLPVPDSRAAADCDTPEDLRRIEEMDE